MRASRIMRHVARSSYGRATLAAGSLVAGGLVVHQLQTPANCESRRLGWGIQSSVFAWGGGMSGALGTGGTANSPVPSHVDLPGDAAQVAAPAVQRIRCDSCPKETARKNGKRLATLRRCQDHLCSIVRTLPRISIAPLVKKHACNPSRVSFSS